jgi:HSP20 family protein
MLSRYNVSNPLLPAWGLANPGLGIDQMMRQLFQDFEMALERPWLAAVRPATPRVRVRAAQEDIQLQVDLPGYRMQDIEIGVEGKTFTLRVAAPAPATPEGFSLVHGERKRSALEWSMELPYPIEVEAANASFDHGRLSISLPKSAAARPRVIPVKTA